MRRTFILSMVMLIATGLVHAQGDGAGRQEALYKRLGGYDALAAGTDDFITRLATDNRWPSSLTA